VHFGAGPRGLELQLLTSGPTNSGPNTS
jgi:hypothetical protein